MAIKNKSLTEAEIVKREVARMLNEERIKLFIQMLDFKRDNNMTRIYSAIHPKK